MKHMCILSLIFSCIYLIRIHSTHILVKKNTKEITTRAVLPRLAKVGHRTEHKHFVHTKNLTHDASGITRQQVAYNLDLLNHNGSSMLLYSQDKDVIDGGFTEWSSWSECSGECGKRSLRSRERYCTNPAPANEGADCDGERFQLNLCKLVPCPEAAITPKHRNEEDSKDRSIDNDKAEKSPTNVIPRLGEWSGWSKCRCKDSYQKRYRECYSHGGLPCPGSTVETKFCKPKGCQGEEESSLVNINPKDICGFNPCDFSKCLVSPVGSCVSDYKCRPVFFDEKSKRVEECVGKRIFINPEKVSQMCKVNPCEFTRCLLDFTEERCVVGTRCQAVYYNAEGQPQKCTAILKVPAREACGYDPCSGETCQASPNARCLVSSKCRPIYVNAFNERIKKCEEEAGKKSNKVELDKEEEFEAEPDEDEEDEDDDDDDDDDEGGGEDESVPKYGHDEDGETEEDGFKNVENGDHDDNVSDDEDGDDNDDSGDDSDNEISDDDSNHDDDNQNDHYAANDKGNRKDDGFMNTFRERAGNDRFNQPRNVKVTANVSTGNLSLPFLGLQKTELGQRRTQKTSHKIYSNNINASSLNLDDIVRGKLNHSEGVITGTVKKSMKIISSKKPATFYYFETKGGAVDENRQFMVITAPKTKKSSVMSKSPHTTQS